MATITEIVLGSGDVGSFDKNLEDFDILRDAVVTAGLGGALGDLESELTVFAPNDGAFVDLANTLGYGGNNEQGSLNYIIDSLNLLSAGNPVGLLTEFLTYHVVGEELNASDVLSSKGIITLQGGVLQPKGTPEAPKLKDADKGISNPNIIATDIEADNGIVHVLDGVLFPLSVTDILSQPGTDFEIGNKTSEVFKTHGGADFIEGRGGADTIKLGAGKDVGFGGNGADMVYGGKGQDALGGGAGKDMLVGGRGSDTFIFKEGDARDVIADFGRGNDKIDVSDLGITRFKEIRDDISDKNGNAVINFGDGDRLVLNDFEAANLGANDFIFG